MDTKSIGETKILDVQIPVTLVFVKIAAKNRDQCAVIGFVLTIYLWVESGCVSVCHAGRVLNTSKEFSCELGPVRRQ